MTRPLRFGLPPAIRYGRLCLDARAIGAGSAVCSCSKRSLMRAKATAFL
jgi:hypothetical protein